MKTIKYIYLLLFVALFSACNDPYEDSTYQVYDMNPVSSYLETRSDEFSEWIAVLKYADLFNAVNQASTYFTALVPTNDAMRSFYQKKEVTSIEELGKEYAVNLAKYHIVKDSINLLTFIKGGELEARTLSDDNLSVSFDETSTASGFNSTYVNNDSHVRELAIRVSNGYVYVLDGVMAPLIENLYERITESADKYSIFISALDQTSWKDSLSIIYDDVKQPDNTTIKQKRDYTVLAVSDETYWLQGITSVADLAAKIGAVGTDYTDKANELFRYVAYHVIGGSHSIFEFESFSGTMLTRLWTTQAEAVLDASRVNGVVYLNYKGEIAGEPVKATFIERNSDVKAKNGVIHELDGYLPLWESQVPIRVDWDFCDYPEVAAYIKGGYGVAGQQYQTVHATSEYQTDVTSLACYTVDAKSSATGLDKYFRVGYATARATNAWKDLKNGDQMYLNLGYNGSVTMKSPMIIVGKYKVIMKVSYATSQSFMRTMSNNSNGGKIQFMFDGDPATAKEVPIYAGVTGSTLGAYDVVLYDELEFTRTSAHTMRMMVADPSASTNSNFRIQLDYMWFEPIIEE